MNILPTLFLALGLTLPIDDDVKLLIERISPENVRQQLQVWRMIRWRDAVPAAAARRLHLQRRGGQCHWGCRGAGTGASLFNFAYCVELFDHFSIFNWRGEGSARIKVLLRPPACAFAQNGREPERGRAGHF